MRRRLAHVAGILALVLAAPVAGARPPAGSRGAGAARNHGERRHGAGPAPARVRRPTAHLGGERGQRHGGVPRRTGKPTHLPPPEQPRPAASIGSPTEGRLEGGVELSPGPTLHLKHAGGARWGLPRLVSLVERGARKVHARFDGAVMLVGDLSRSRGGELGGHRSHESGRDADVGFYYVDAKGRDADTQRFHHVGWDGRTTDDPSLHFDDARNWELVKAWVTDPGARVQHIFIAEPLRQRLLRLARRQGTYLPVLQRAAIAMKQPRHAEPHDDHFHVRIACPSGQADVCVAEPGPEPRPAHPAPRRVR